MCINYKEKNAMPVARIFYGEVRYNEETDRASPGRRGRGVGEVGLYESAF